MRRRHQTLAAEDMPPARLLAYREEDWLPMVNLADYSRDRWRAVSAGRHVGDPEISPGEWRQREAVATWTRARFAWHAEHGWPGVRSVIDLIAETHRLRQALRRRGSAVSTRTNRPDAEWHWKCVYCEAWDRSHDAHRNCDTSLNVLVDGSYTPWHPDSV